MKLVSVIVPVYNAEKWLNKCLDSIVNQTYNKLEIVLVDDGSTDNSLKICNEYKKKDNRITVISIENNGVANCRNIGLDNAHGDYVLYVDSDDWIEINTVELLYKVAMEHKVSIVVCNMTTEDRHIVNIDTPVKTLSENELMIEFIKHKIINGSFCNKLIDKKLLENLHFNSDIGYGEDADLLWEIIKRKPITGVTEYTLYHYCNNPNSISRKKFNPIKFDAMKVWGKILDDVKTNYPNLLDYAKAAFADANLITLWEMAKVRYDDVNRIKFIDNLRKYHKTYYKAGWISKKRKAFAAMVMINYKIAGYLLRMINR